MLRFTMFDASASLHPAVATRISTDKSAFGELAISRPEFACFRHVTDRRSEKKLDLKLALMGKRAGDLVHSQAGSFSSI
jgi:hypothetical protein